MAQGQHKAKTATQQLKIAKKLGANRVQRGQRKAPKSNLGIKEKKMQKKLGARNIQNTEIQMSLKAASTGKLTIMKSVAEKALKEKKEKDSKKK
jgi:Protein of unknown function (DUF2462)